jgi:protein phosphatase
VTLADQSSVAEGADWWLELPGAAAKEWSSNRWTHRSPRARTRAAGRQVPRERIPANHLRRGIRSAENLERLRQRGLSAKRSLALREFALGVEGLERFVGREPLRKIHECVFGVLPWESERVDPRL